MNSRTRYLPPLMLITALAFSGVISATSRPAPQKDVTISQAEIGQLDRFLDTHPDIAEAIAKNPSLIDTEAYIATQPALRAFLQDHPEIRADLRTNPRVMLKDLVRLDTAEAASTRPATRADALSVSQVNALDSFMDAHPVIAKQLEANPSLINDKKYLNDNPDLVTFLRDHPDLRLDWRSNPQAAMNALAAVDAAQAKAQAKATVVSDRQNDDLSRAQVTTLDGFMDSHPAITKQLEANPALIDDRAYLSDHPELVVFLRDHADLAQGWRSNPRLAMKDLAMMDAATTLLKPTPAAAPKVADDAITRGEVATFDAFLDQHPAITEQLRAHPSLIAESSFVSDNPELKAFVGSHPAIGVQLRTNANLLLRDVVKYDQATSAKAESNVRRPLGVRK